MSLGSEEELWLAGAVEEAETVSEGTEGAIEAAAGVLKQAAEDNKVSPAQVLQAMLTLQKLKVSPDGWPEKLGGSKSPGRTWRLVFVSSEPFPNMSC